VDEKEIRSFLVAHPRGAKILVRDENDELHEIASPNGKGITWAHIARSIDALKHVYIELQDSEGKLVRATRTTGGEKEKAEAQALMAVPSHADPETARLTHFANLLSDAYKFSTGLAFEKMVALSQMSVDRMMAIETRLERTEANYRREMKERLDDAFERAEEMAAEAEQQAQQQNPGLLEQFALGMANGQRDAKTVDPPPKPNGRS
jgi:hypothetical protein